MRDRQAGVIVRPAGQIDKSEIGNPFLRRPYFNAALDGIKLEGDAQKELARWNDLKRRKYGQLPKAKDKIPAMPEDSTIAPA